MSAGKVKNGKLVYILFVLLGFLSGLPYSLLTSTLQAWFISSQADRVTIGSLSLIMLAFSFKPLMGMVADYLRLIKVLSYEQLFFVVSIALSICFYHSSGLDPVQDFKWMLLVMTMAAFCSSYLDTIVDGLLVLLVESECRAYVSVCFATAYRLALLVSGGGVMLFVQSFGYGKVYQAMSLLVLFVTFICSMLLVYCKTTVSSSVKEPTLSSIMQQWTLLIDWLSKPDLLYVLAFGVLLRGHEFILGSSLPVYLLRDLAIGEVVYGGLYKMIGVCATLLGGAVTGRCLHSWKKETFIQFIILLQLWASMLFMLVQYTSADPLIIIPNYDLFGMASFSGFVLTKRLALLSASIVLEQFASGLATTTLVVLFMSSCNRHFAATQYALLTATLNTIRSFVGPMGARIQFHGGWDLYFVASVVVLVPLVLLMQHRSLDDLFGREEVSAY